MRMRHRFQWIGEREQATGKVRPGVAFEFEHDGLDTPSDPDFAAHDSFGAIINLAANHAVMNPKSHASIMRGSQSENNNKSFTTLKCPVGGGYTINAVGEKLTCSIPQHELTGTMTRNPL
jgi:hypothetical protein